MTKQTCQKCGSTWETNEPNGIWDWITKSWIIIDPSECQNCMRKDGV